MIDNYFYTLKNGILVIVTEWTNTTLVCNMYYSAFSIRVETTPAKFIQLLRLAA